METTTQKDRVLIFFDEKTYNDTVHQSERRMTAVNRMIELMKTEFPTIEVTAKDLHALAFNPFSLIQDRFADKLIEASPVPIKKEKAKELLQIEISEQMKYLIAEVTQFNNHNVYWPGEHAFDFTEEGFSLKEEYKDEIKNTLTYYAVNDKQPVALEQLTIIVQALNNLTQAMPEASWHRNLFGFIGSDDKGGYKVELGAIVGRIK